MIEPEIQYTCIDCPSWPVFWFTVTAMLVAAVGAFLVFRSLPAKGCVVAWCASSPLLALALLCTGVAYQQLFGHGWHGSLRG